MINSLWAETAKLPSFPSLEQDLKTDILIVGGGMAGLLCACALNRACADYALIEADRICGGVTRNTTAKITSQHGLIYDKLIGEYDVETARLYYEANQAAMSSFRRLAADYPCQMETKPAFVYTTGSTEKLGKELQALERIGAKAGYRDSLPLPFAVTGAIEFEDQAQFHPLLLAAGIAAGLNIYGHTPARGFEGNTVYTDKVRIEAKKILIATHFPIINKHGGYFLKLFQDRSYVLALENATDPAGMFIGAEGCGPSIRSSGDLLLFGGGAHPTGKKGGGYAELEALARSCYPGARIKYRWAAQDCMSLDGIPYIGHYGKNTPELYVATGFNKWGMTSSMVSAMILSDLLLERENPYAKVFSPQRSSMHPQLLVNAFHAAANLLTPTRPRCPHMGCALKWNEEEQSWDCPCHGSRFTAEGELLDGPATGNLKKHP
ncbi:MAG: FAD-dependent oxidoreductase [Clostridiales bacterium]|nr:FAD-dependent oxidoreductase [Clostridiales bacterium]